MAARHSWSVKGALLFAAHSRYPTTMVLPVPSCALIRQHPFVVSQRRGSTILVIYRLNLVYGIVLLLRRDAE